MVIIMLEIEEISLQSIHERIPGLPFYRVTIGADPIVVRDKIITWCRERIGMRWDSIFGKEGVWECRYLGYSLLLQKPAYVYEFIFDYEQDALLFSLKWS